MEGWIHVPQEVGGEGIGIVHQFAKNCDVMKWSHAHFIEKCLKVGPAKTWPTRPFATALF